MKTTSIEQNIKYKEQLLGAWEDTYKKGQLTFWLLLGLRDNRLYVSEIKEFIESVTNNSVSCEEQSIYRSLRKYYDLEIVDFELRSGVKGPDRKYYFLTAIGKSLLRDFIERNISLFYNKRLARLIKKTQ